LANRRSVTNRRAKVASPDWNALMTLSNILVSPSPDLDQVLDPASYRAAMRNHAGAVTILSTGLPGGRTGLTATSVCSLSDSPPRIIACVNRSASAHGLIRQTGAFGVNMLRAGQTELAGLFAGRNGIERESRFSDADGWISVVTGAPILRHALASLDCRFIEEHPHDTHSIFIGEVKAVRVQDVDDPLIYFGGQFRSLGKSS
jgi:cob(II)yrinic acid a,c-diamide reductase